ncbi:MAG TPA: hypothetical protein VF145_04315 [Chitinophagaceae bacterium]
MKKINTLAGWACTLLLATGLSSGCTKSAANPEEIKGPKETVVLPLLNISDQQVGSLYIDDMSGRARARISLNNGYYTAGENMKANVTLTSGSGTTVYAHCTDVDGGTGKCTTFPIKVLSDNSDATFSHVTTTNGLVFNVLDRNNNVFARTAKHTIVIDN